MGTETRLSESSLSHLTWCYADPTDCQCYLILPSDTQTAPAPDYCEQCHNNRGCSAVHVPTETPVAVHALGGRAQKTNCSFLRSLRVDFHRDHTNWHPYLQSLRVPLERNLCLWKSRSARLPLIHFHPTRFKKQGWNDGMWIQVTTAALREFLGVLSELLDIHGRGEVT